MWNETSFLFEVFWCVMLYFTVTAIETSPTILERWNLSRYTKPLHRITPYVVFFGISLSCLHHSSLGSLFLVTPQRLHPLWYSSLLPIFFFTSAVGGGLMVVVLARLLYARWYNPEPIYGTSSTSQSSSVCSLNAGSGTRTKGSPGRDMPILTGLASISGLVLALYLLLKLVDLLWSGSTEMLFRGTWESWFYLTELIFAAVIPVCIVTLPRTRTSPKWIGLAASSAVTGLVMNRLDVGIFGYFQDSGTAYFPSILEWALSLGVIAGGVLVFMLCIENFPFFDNDHRVHDQSLIIEGGVLGNPLRVPQIILRKGLRRMTLIAVFIIPLAWLTLYPPYTQGRVQLHPAEASLGVDPMRTILRIDGDRSGVFTEFPHTDHQSRLGNESSCRNCHHISYPGDQSTSCSQCHKGMVNDTLIFNHFQHMEAVAIKEELAGWWPENHSCSVCHSENKPKESGSAESCFKCHDQNMSITGHPKAGQDFKYAPSFQTAMHQTCITCHRKEATRLNRPSLADCSTCHPSIRSRESLLSSVAVYSR
jgi:Ni/Fe-hydrogenase subunit HybB-like protein